MKGLRYIFLVVLALSLFSCKKFKGSQEIPAYLRVEKWAFSTDYDVEGASTQAITDAWVYIDGSLHGCFELKWHKEDGTYAMIPVLKEGEHTLQIYPGVKLNGISSTRIQYPFYKPYVINASLTQGDILKIKPSTRYYSTDSTHIEFLKSFWEDFEDKDNIKLRRPDTTYANLVQISHRTDPNAWMDPYDTIKHYRSGYVHIGDTALKRFCLTSRDSIVGIPGVGNYVLLEMDYKCSSDILVGLYLKSAQEGIIDKELVYLKPTNSWNKVYLNFSPIFNENPNISYVKYYFKGAVSGEAAADFYFDNLKLIYL